MLLLCAHQRGMIAILLLRLFCMLQSELVVVVIAAVQDILESVLQCSHFQKKIT
jgi:hypothetical protein